jgi:4-amino-4-deoxy-L-arabinose transferase-like glycosyltransferase
VSLDSPFITSGTRLASAGRHSRVDALEPATVWIALVLATILAAALRFPFLGHQSLWFDEIYTRDILGANSLSGLWDHIRNTDSTPPLYYFIGLLFGGRSAADMRAIPAAALVLSVPVAFLAFRSLIGERAALASAWILAVSPILVSYSTNARAYGLLVLTGLLTIWAFSAVLEGDDWKPYLLWVLASVACVWTHYFGGFLVAAEIVVLLVVRPDMQGPTIRWSLVVLVALLPLIPLIAHQTGDERSAFIAGTSVTSRLSTTVRQFATGPNVPRAWLEAAGLAIWVLAVVGGAVRALVDRNRDGIVLGLVLISFGLPLLTGVVGFEDRFYVRNVITAVPLLAALSAPVMLRLRAVPLIAYLALAILTSVWVASNWRYQEADWHGALNRVESIDPRAPVLAIGDRSEPVVRTYLNRDPVPTQRLVTRQAWIVVQGVRGPHERAFNPAPIPAIPGFIPKRALLNHAFRLMLVRARRPTALTAATIPQATLFAGGSGTGAG